MRGCEVICPTPHKKSHFTEASAISHRDTVSRLDSHAPAETLGIYLCDCGAWHVGHGADYWPPPVFPAPTESNAGLLPFPGPGLIYDMPSEEYHRIDATGSSALKTIHGECPMIARDRELNGLDQTDDMFLGTVAHALCLEGASFESRFIAGDQCAATIDTKQSKNYGQRCSNDGIKRVHGEWLCGSHSKGLHHDDSRQVVTKDEMENARGMEYRLREDVEAARLLWGSGEDEGYSEVSAFAVCPITGQKLKARFDRYMPRGAGGLPHIPDLKKCQDAGPDGFRKQNETYFLYIQAGHYCRVASLATKREHSSFEFIAIGAKRPWAPACYTVPIDLLELGIRHSIAALKMYKMARDLNFWPSYHSHRAKPLEVSRWMQNQIEGRR